MATTGVGCYPNIAAAATGVLAALIATAKRAVADATVTGIGAPDVELGNAFDMLGSPNMSPDLVGVEIESTQLDAGTLGTTRREKHTIKLQLTVIVFRQTDDLSETVARAWEILGLIETQIRTVEQDLTDPANPSEHPALWCRLPVTRSASAAHKTDGGYLGRITGIEATYDVAVIVQN